MRWKWSQGDGSVWCEDLSSDQMQRLTVAIHICHPGGPTARCKMEARDSGKLGGQLARYTKWQRMGDPVTNKKRVTAKVDL